MAITYSWDCKTVDTYPTHSDSQSPSNTQNDVVYNVHWRLTGIEGDHSHTVIGTQNLTVDNLSSFTAFGSLDNTTVTGWVKTSLDNDTAGRVADLESIVSSSIAEKASPTSVRKTIE